MTNVAARKVLADFERDVQRVDQLLNLIHRFREFAGDESALSGHAEELWKSAQEVRTDLPVFSGSLMLYLCGRFESFVKELVGTVVDELVDKAECYDDLPAELRKVYVTRVLAINENPGRFNHTREMALVLAAELANNLSGKDDGSLSLAISATTIAITEANLRPNVLADLFKRVGYINVWDTLGRQLPLLNHFSERPDGDCKRAAIARLEEIMNERNKIAHPSATDSSASFPDAYIVEGVAEYLGVLAQVLGQMTGA